MNRMDSEQRARILHLLREGSSIRAIKRLTGASKNTVTKLMIDAGKACAAYHDAHVQNLTTKRERYDSFHGISLRSISWNNTAVIRPKMPTTTMPTNM